MYPWEACMPGSYPTDDWRFSRVEEGFIIGVDL